MTRKELSSHFNVSVQYIDNVILFGKKYDLFDYEKNKKEIRNKTTNAISYGYDVFDLKNNLILSCDSYYELEKESYNKLNILVTRSGVSAVCTNKQKSHRGYIFKYKNNAGKVIIETDVN